MLPAQGRRKSYLPVICYFFKHQLFESLCSLGHWKGAPGAQQQAADALRSADEVLCHLSL